MRRALKVSVYISFFCLLSVFIASKVGAVAISPDKYFLKSEGDGVTLNQELIIFGKTDRTEPYEVYLYAENMEFSAEDGTRSFYRPKKDALDEPANWIKLSESKVTVTPGEDLVIPWTITPTSTAKCGTNLAAIVVTPEEVTDDTQEGAKVDFRNEIVSQIHIDINNTYKSSCVDNATNLGLFEFKLDSLFPVFFNIDVPYVTRLKNSGNLIARMPRGFIEIFGFGAKVSLDFNPENYDIYPDTIRRFDNKWLDEETKSGDFFTGLFAELRNLRIGQYEARLGITKNVSPQLVSSVYFWVFPWRTILLVVIIIIISVYFYSSRKNKKNKNEPKMKVNKKNYLSKN